MDRAKNEYLKKMLKNYHEELNEGGTIYDFANKNISWIGVVSLDTIVYPTLKGTLDIERKGALFLIHAIITLPDGTAKATDEWQIIVGVQNLC